MSKEQDQKDLELGRGCRLAEEAKDALASMAESVNRPQKRLNCAGPP